MPDSKMLLNKLFEHAPRSVNVKDLKVDGLYIYGKVVTVAGIYICICLLCRNVYKNMQYLCYITSHVYFCMPIQFLSYEKWCWIL